MKKPLKVTMMKLMSKANFPVIPPTRKIENKLKKKPKYPIKEDEC